MRKLEKFYTLSEPSLFPILVGIDDLEAETICVNIAMRGESHSRSTSTLNTSLNFFQYILAFFHL